MRKKRDLQTGFTLFEVLVSLAIIGLIFSGLAGYAQIGAGISDRVQSKSRLATGEAGLAMTVGILRGARDVLGTAERITFVGQMPQALDAPGLYLIELRAGRDGGLTLSSRPRTEGPRGAAEGNLDRLELLPASLHVQFFYYDGTTRLIAWREAGQEPRLVEIVATPDGATPRTLRVAPLFGTM